MPHRCQQIQEKIAAWRRTGYPVKGYPGLVFAPVLTILASLREPSEALYSQILPPCLYRRLEAICRLFFTQEGEKDLAVVRGSRYNLVVTNTVKIRIQKRVRQHPTWTRLRFAQIVRLCLRIQPGVGRRVCSRRGPRLFSRPRRRNAAQRRPGLEGQRIQIAQARGLPMLQWVGTWPWIA